MSLDLSKVAGQVSNMADSFRAGYREHELRLQSAVVAFGKQAEDFNALKDKIVASRGTTTWLVAGLSEGLGGSFPPPPVLTDFTVLATDGSHIDIDRHHSPHCYLINTGRVQLTYGKIPGASLGNIPRLYFNDEDLAVGSAGDRDRQQMIEGQLLSIKRGVEECRELAEMAAARDAGTCNLALLDGSLIFWGLMNKTYPEYVVRHFLVDGFLGCLDGLRRLNSDKKLAVASYISFPRSSDVVNALRVGLCPREIVDTDRYCKKCEKRECEAVAEVPDRDLFNAILKPGERSPVFYSQSQIVEDYYGDLQKVFFFYLRAEDEIARVEIPAWVAQNPDLLALAHGLVLDQCRRGQGYPVALSEAHEQAVITGADRDNFWQMVEMYLQEGHLSTANSAKSLSKRTRWV